MTERDHVVNALAATRASAVALSPERVEALRLRIESRYAAPGVRPLWERLNGSLGRRRADGWAQICAFVGDREVFLFFDRDRTHDAWAFENGTALHAVLADCPGMELYVTDADASYVLCHNHHDIVIGVGACRAWVEALREAP